MKLNIQLTSNSQQILAEMRGFSGGLAQSVASAMDRENELTVGHISRTKLRQRGPKTLGAVSRLLSESVRRTTAVVSGSSISSTIGSNVKYAAVHEFGAGPFTIRAKPGKALRFFAGGNVVFARSVNHPGFPARGMFAAGLEERAENYSQSVSKAIEEAWSK